MLAIVRVPELLLILSASPARTRPGGSGIATPDHGPQTANTKAKARPLGPRRVDNVEESLARVENPVEDLPSRDCHRLGTSRVQNILAVEVHEAAWATCKGPGVDPAHPPDVERQPDLGQSGMALR